MKNRVFLLILMFGCGFMVSQTNVSGGIFTNTVWTKVNSPYIVTDTVVVFPGVTLTIQPGVTVRFKDSINMEIRGTLLAIGSPTDSIHFTSVSQIVSPNAFWAPLTGIRVNVDLGGKTTIDHSKFTYLDGGISWENWTTSGVSSSVSNSLFFKNARGLLGETYYWVYIKVNKCNFINNECAIGYSWYYDIRNCNFTGNLIGVEGEEMNIDNSVFCGNARAISAMSGNFDSLTISKNITGFQLLSSNGITITKSHVFMNDTGIILGPNSFFITITNNNLCNNNFYNVVHTDSYNINMANNCWCTTNTVTISSKIYDAYDNFSLGIINYTPFSNCTSTVLPTGINCNSFATGNYSIEKLDNTRVYNVFPNPNRGSFKLQIENEIENGELVLINSLGQEVFREKIITGINDISTLKLAIGLYSCFIYQSKQIIGIGKVAIE